MGAHTVKRGTVDDSRTAAALLATALHDDLVIRWLLRDPEERALRQMRFFLVFVEYVLQRQELQQGELQLHLDGETPTGAALWLAVGAADEVAGPSTGLIEDALGPDAFARYRKLDQQMNWHHPPDVRHAYLRFIAAAPTPQGRVILSRLLDTKLDPLDDEGIPVYLEATNAGSRDLAQRHGFLPLGDSFPLPAGPFVHPMWRQPLRWRGPENSRW